MSIEEEIIKLIELNQITNRIEHYKELINENKKIMDNMDYMDYINKIWIKNVNYKIHLKELNKKEKKIKKELGITGYYDFTKILNLVKLVLYNLMDKKENYYIGTKGWNQKKKEAKTNKIIGILELENNKIIAASPFQGRNVYLSENEIMCKKCQGVNVKLMDKKIAKQKWVYCTFSDIDIDKIEK